MLSFRLFILIDEIVLVGVLVTAYVIMRLTGRLQTICFPAVVSAGCAILNTFVVHGLFSLMRFPLRNDFLYFGFFADLLVAIVAGHIALRRIRRSPTPMRGRALAWVGLSLGYVGILLAIVIFIGVVQTLSGIKG
jgi:hypothetical protein